MTRAYSSGSTPILKYLLGPAWTLGFGYGTYELWTNPTTITDNGVVRPVVAADQWLFLGMFLLGATRVLALLVPLKRVRITADGLLVSNYIREVRIPLSEVQDVTQCWWAPPRIVVVQREDALTPSKRCSCSAPMSCSCWQRSPSPR